MENKVNIKFIYRSLSCFVRFIIIHLHCFRIFVGTWNVNEQVPTKEVSSWLSVDDEPPDLFVLG